MGTTAEAASMSKPFEPGSAIDTLVVASADTGMAVLTGDPKGLIAIADHAHEVTVHVV